MFRRQTEGAVVCTSCGSLVGVRDAECLTCGRRNPGLWGFAPVLRRLGQDLGFVTLVTVTCGVLYVVSLLLGGPQAQGGGMLGILSPDRVSLFLLGSSGAVPVFGFGRWWTVLSAGWLHGGLLHIVFNMMWVRQLAPATAELYGPGRTVVLYTIAGVSGFAASSLAGMFMGWMPLPMLRGAQFTVGASAPIFGLLGALVYYGRRSGSSAVRSQAVGYALMLGVFGLIMPGIDNYGHGGGFLGGYLAGRIMDPLKPERLDHLLMALACLVATALAILASVVFGLPLVR
ncbi:rhomboid family intramembrane serine protease [Luteitalea sp.]|uniref:rhomboid family intramembrane serine protease n=1 Tax=Luteitalea sp. TaxID=2004800 RepID=UPI0025C64EBD|nr:rhomboid family intramembrane serine protease [Luteitalea sp.]